MESKLSLPAGRLRLNIKLKGEAGFTLLESLLVLSLASIMLIAVFTTLPPVYENTALRQTVSQLKNDILLAQTDCNFQSSKNKNSFSREKISSNHR